MAAKSHPPTIAPLTPPQPERCVEPIHVSAEGSMVDDPLTVLGLNPDQIHDADAIQAAWLEALKAHPPETDPDGARRVRAARERLTDAKHMLARYVGVLHVPDPDAWGLATTDTTSDHTAAMSTPTRVPAARRLLGQAMLYTLVEEEFI